jgi:arylsulfatase A-like enzyme
LRETTELVGYKHLAFGVPEWRFYLERIGYRPDEIDQWERDLSDLEGRELRAEQYQIYMRRYLQCVHSIDENVGRVLHYLDENQLAEETLVVYTSDQGFFLGEHGLFDKRFIYEPSLRIPLLARWPGRIKAGTTTDALVQNLDFAPTMLEAAGQSAPRDIQGRSALAVAEGRTPDDWRDAIYYRYWMNRAHFNVPAHLGVRTSRYKLVYFYDSDRGPDGSTLVRGARPNVREPFWELYDLERDPLEVENRIDDPAYRSRVADLKRRLQELRQLYEDDQDGLRIAD